MKPFNIKNSYCKFTNKSMQTNPLNEIRAPKKSLNLFFTPEIKKNH